MTDSRDPHRRLTVFLCHSSSDKAAVRKFYSQLLADGYDPWLDEEKIMPGQDWHLEITKAVRSVDIVIVCSRSWGYAALHPRLYADVRSTD